MTVIRSLPIAVWVIGTIVLELVLLWSLIFQMNTPQQKPNRIIVYVAMLSMLCALFDRIVVDSNASEMIKDIADYSVFGALVLLMLSCSTVPIKTLKAVMEKGSITVQSKSATLSVYRKTAKSSRLVLR